MSDLRENLTWILGSIATAIAMAFGWLVSSGVVVNLIFLLVGFAITYFVQTMTQKRAWKREYSVRIAEEVYGSLFSGVKGIILSLKNKRYWYIDFNVWREMQDDHRYFMVDKAFRVKLDQFRERLEKYSKTVIEVRSKILPKIVFEEAERALGVKTDMIPRVNVIYEEELRRFSSSPEFVDCLISKTHPAKHATRNKSDISSITITYEFQRIKEGKKSFSSPPNVELLNSFWESCLKRAKEDKYHKFIVEENDTLLEEARKLKQEIAKRIEEPWKI